MSFPKYPKRKESGVEWLGEVPEHWLFKRLSSLCRFESGKAHEPFIEEDARFVCVNSRFVSTEGESRKYCTKNLSPAKRNDILMVMSDLPNGRALAKAYFVNDDDIYAVNQRVCILTPIEDSPRFLFYLLNRNPLFLLHDDGVNQTHLSNAIFTKFPVSLPPLPEQTAIASFLDRETGKIDELVAEQRRLIELLKEKRQAVISHAVTKGLNPDAPMKPSGIEWLGDVPEHWAIAKVKFASHRISKGDTPSNFGMEFAVDGPVRFIKIENIGEGELNEMPRYSIDFEAHEQLTRSQLQANDIVFAIAGATTGKCALVRAEHLPANTNQAVAYIRPNERVNPPFLVAWLQNSRLQEAMWEITSQSAQPNLSMENLGNLPIPIPDKHEQEQIVHHVKDVGGGYFTLQEQAKRAIDLLQERRTAIISAAVTGKIDVRGLIKAGDH